MKISARDYRNLLRTGQLPGPASFGCTATRVISHEESDLEDAVIGFLELYKWRVTHHEPFRQCGPPLNLTPGNEKASTILGALTRLGARILPRVYLPIARVRDVDRGWPDLICVHPDGHVLLVEVKRAKKWCYRPGQKEFLAVYSKSACLVSSLDELARELRERGLPGQDARL